MPMDPPLYDIGDTVYLRESAALGFLEAMSINSVMRKRGEWIYSFAAKSAQPTPVSHHGDRINSVAGMILYFTESELLLYCDALTLAEANVQRQLDQLQAQRANLCTESSE